MLATICTKGASFPAIFAFEIEDILIVAERRRRIDEADIFEATDRPRSERGSTRLPRRLVHELPNEQPHVPFHFGNRHAVAGEMLEQTLLEESVD